MKPRSVSCLEFKDHHDCSSYRIPRFQSSGTASWPAYVVELFRPIFPASIRHSYSSRRSTTSQISSDKAFQLWDRYHFSAFIHLKCILKAHQLHPSRSQIALSDDLSDTVSGYPSPISHQHPLPQPLDFQTNRRLPHPAGHISFIYVPFGSMNVVQHGTISSPCAGRTGTLNHSGCAVSIQIEGGRHVRSGPTNARTKPSVWVCRAGDPATFSYCSFL